MTESNRNSRRGGKDRPDIKYYRAGSGLLPRRGNNGNSRDDVSIENDSTFAGSSSKSSKVDKIHEITDEFNKIAMGEKQTKAGGVDFGRRPPSTIAYSNTDTYDQRANADSWKPANFKPPFNVDKLEQSDLRKNRDEKSGKKRSDRRRKDRGGRDDRFSGKGVEKEDGFSGGFSGKESVFRNSQTSQRKDSDARLMRHGSEPRSLPTYQDNRSRDARSMETKNLAQDRISNRPPVQPFVQNLPPRLLNKTKEVKEAEAQANENLRREDLFSFPIPPQDRSRTLPYPRGRGRGRIRPDDADRFQRRPAMSERLTDPVGSRDSFVFHNKNTDHDRFQDGTEEKENHEREVMSSADNRRSAPNLSEITRSGQEKEEIVKPSSSSVLDWAEEVERVEREEILRMSRTNSRESLRESGQTPSRSQRKKKKKRSISRDRGRGEHFRRGSVDNVSNHSRNNSVERSWRNHPVPANRSRQNSYCDNRSRQSSFCDSRSRQSSPDRKVVERHRKNSSCDNRSRQSSLDRRENWRSRHDGGGQPQGNHQRNERSREQSTEPVRNWRSEMTPPKDTARQAAGILVLPSPIQNTAVPPPSHSAAPLPSQHAQRRLYNPSNPDKHIVMANTSKIRSAQEIEQNYLTNCSAGEHPMYTVPSSELLSSQTPPWYNPYKENFQQSRNPQLIRRIAQADFELQYLLSSGELLHYWDGMQQLRYSLKEFLRIFLVTDLRFCEAENVEQHLWKILYYNVIELIRKQIAENFENKESYKRALLSIIDDGLDYYEKLLVEVENSNQIKLDNFLNAPSSLREKLGFTGLALIAGQKIYLCLGDLARYKEQANDTSNYGLSRQWYLKAHQINPKNGRPYNQLALLAMYTKRKMDAVYYYMRCLMSSNPMMNAREGLITVLDENRKKFEAIDRLKKDERARKEREKMKEKEGMGEFRREIWIHPSGGKNVHRTTSTCHQDIDSDEEELSRVSSGDLSKIFCTSYLHVLGKLYNKIGMESLTETAVQMLREFRALLQHSPMQLDSTKLLQILSLNMFAIEVTQPKAEMSQSRDGIYRSAAQESALVVSLQMFNLLLERFVVLLQKHVSNKDQKRLIPPECELILPALKVWCDWMTTHVEVWNPPPSCVDYRVGPAGDCWNRIATLVTLLLKMDFPRDMIVDKDSPEHRPLYLPEDATLCGFTPLMANAPESLFVHQSNDMELAQTVCRLKKLEFFGQIILCGLDPPVLKLHKKEDGESEYISIVDIAGSQEEAANVNKCEPIGEQSESEVFHESMSSSDESDDSGKATGVEEDDGESVQCLIAKKGRLERQARRLQARKNYFQKALMAEVLTEMEVRPHDLVPDTNCFINSLPEIENLLKLLPNPQYPYVIMVPLVVLNELEGLSRGCKPSQSALHSVMVRETAKTAMTLLQNRHMALKCVTTKGTVLPSAAFTLEEDSTVEMKNDDKILTTCVNLSKSLKRDEVKEGGRRKLYRTVVLLTDDRPLRLKAIAKDMPVRTLPDFLKWAGLG